MPRQCDSVLLVEDDVALVGIEALALSAEGYRVAIAGDGRAALEQLAREQPDVILLDIRMPGVDGSRFMASFRATYGCEIPVIVVTAAEDAARRATDVGADDWLAKPFELDELLDKVAKHVRRAPGDVAAAIPPG